MCVCVESLFSRSPSRAPCHGLLHPLCFESSSSSSFSSSSSALGAAHTLDEPLLLLPHASLGKRVRGANKSWGDEALQPLPRASSPLSPLSSTLRQSPHKLSFAPPTPTPPRASSPRSLLSSSSTSRQPPRASPFPLPSSCPSSPSPHTTLTAKVPAASSNA